VLQSGRGIVDRIDALTRLNRQRGVGQVMVSHTMSDLLALPAAEDRMKAKGFVERSGMVIYGGLARSETDQLTEVVRLTEDEIETISGWQDPGRLVGERATRLSAASRVTVLWDWIFSLYYLR
jgi:hypothetical protein